MDVIEKMAAEKDVQGLLEILEKGDIVRKLRATDALGEIGDEAVPALIEKIGSGDHNIRGMGAIALGKIGDSAVESLIGVLSGPEAARVPATWALAEIGDERAKDPLRFMMENDASECCRVMAAAALLKMSDPESEQEIWSCCEKEGSDFVSAVDEAYRGT